MCCAVLEDLCPYVALLVPVEAGSSGQRRQKNDRCLTFTDGHAVVVASQKVAAVVVPELMGDVRGCGAAEGAGPLEERARTLRQKD